VNKKSFIFIGVGAAVAIFALLLVQNLDDSNVRVSNQPVSSLDLDFSYSEANSQLKQSLESVGVSMSSPVRMSDQATIQKYCTLFDDEQKQSLIEYCTSTELLSSEGKFLGNIHIVGSKASPQLVIALVQVDPLMSQIADVKSTFQIIIEELVCDCWDEEKPDGFETIGDWVNGLRKFHTGDVKPHSQSKPILLEGTKIQIELTTNFDGYLWELLVAR
jgi:hypothetical protein